MIKSFRHKGLRQFFETGFVAGIQPHQAGKLHAQLTVLNIAEEPKDMNAAQWKLHQLVGFDSSGSNVQGHWAVRVNGNWRLTFAFEDKAAVLINYQDYH
jgi:proteic killer suppression protein